MREISQKNKTREQNEKDCLRYCLNLSNDPEFLRMIALWSHKDRVDFLLENGFTFEEEV